MEKEHQESERDQADTYEKYLQEINDVGDLPHKFHFGDELQPGFSRSSIPNNVGFYIPLTIKFFSKILYAEYNPIVNLGKREFRLCFSGVQR